MSSPMPISPTMCSICFDTIYEGEHKVDADGDKWDSHSWCDLVDKAQVLKRDANTRRKERGLPTTDELEAEEREYLADA